MSLEAYYEEIAQKLVDLINQNWIMVEYGLKNYLHISLSKRQLIIVAKRALEIMEEKI